MGLFNHKSQVVHLYMICLWAHSDGAHGDNTPTPYHPQPTGGSRGACLAHAPLRVHILSFRHTKFSKCNCLGSLRPTPLTRLTPPTGNPGSTTTTPPHCYPTPPFIHLHLHICFVIVTGDRPLFYVCSGNEPRTHGPISSIIIIML